MSLTNIKKLQSERGFTIVELLIVIVVIGILAAIVIVAYNGITNKANGSAAKANATSVQKAAESYNSECPTGNSACSVGGFPTLANLSTYSADANASTKYPSTLTVNSTGPLAGTNAADVKGTHILYVPKGTTGACIGYWDSTGAGSVGWLFSGNATAATNVAAPVCS